MNIKEGFSYKTRAGFPVTVSNIKRIKDRDEESMQEHFPEVAVCHGNFEGSEQSFYVWAGSGRRFNRGSVCTRLDHPHDLVSLYDAEEEARKDTLAMKTLRDEFAMAALALCIGLGQDQIAERAYEIADAMLKEKEKGLNK